MSDAAKTVKKEPTLTALANEAAAKKQAQAGQVTVTRAETARQKLDALRASVSVLTECLNALAALPADKEGRSFGVEETDDGKQIMIKADFRTGEQRAKAKDKDPVLTDKYVSDVHEPVIGFVAGGGEVLVKIYDLTEMSARNKPYNPGMYRPLKTAVQELAKWCGRQVAGNKEQLEAVGKLLEETQKKLAALEAPAAAPAPAAKPK